jgi:predicted ATP-dependent endonuclease of OLD family
MLLKSLSIRGLYRTLSLDVKFNEEFTLLVGINGSGKTSVLNVVDWLLRPDLQRLALVRYDSLLLRFVEDGVGYELTAKKSPEKVTFSIGGTPKPLEPITILLRPSTEEDDENAEELYQGLSPEKHEIPMWELLKSFSKPTVISLDRTVSAESEEVYYAEVRSGLIRRRAPSRSPVAHVQAVTSSRYAEFRAKAIANDNELKASIVMSALQDPGLAFRGRTIKPMTPEKITQLEEKVSTYLSATIKSADVHEQVQRFFSASREFSKRQDHPKGQRDLIFDFVAAQYRQIESLAKAFNNFEKKNALAFKSLNEYLVSVNRFFNDSEKELFFDESTGKLAFTSRNAPKDGRAAKSVAYLSSGERQILVLFTFLAFASSPRGVFIVDEPELSLHPKWQSEFMDAFLKLRPEGTQLVLATHSPDIVGKYKANCFALRGRKS